jgi:hypothetical protein
MTSSESSVRSKPYRGHNFPYHLNPPTSGGGFRLTTARKSNNNSRSSNKFGESRPGTAPETPSSYMVLNFRSQFIDESIIETLNKDVRIEEKRLRQLQQETGIRKTNFGPNLIKSFVLPRNPDAPVESRNMVGRADIATQSDSNLNKREFDGLSKYQAWSVNEVEPFFKVFDHSNTSI